MLEMFKSEARLEIDQRLTYLSGTTFADQI